MAATEAKATVKMEAIVVEAEFGGGGGKVVVGGSSTERGGELSGEAGGGGGGAEEEDGCWRLVMANFWPAAQWPGTVQMK